VNTWWPLIAIVLLLLVAHGAIVLLALLLAAPMLGRAVASGLADIEDGREGSRRAPEDRSVPQHAVGTASPARPMPARDEQVPPPWPVDATQRIPRIPRADDETAQIRRIR
jgi:hypothetical protein